MQTIIIRPSEALALDDGLSRAAALALDAVGSDHTRRAYRRALLGPSGFLPWLAATGEPMSRATVNAYRRRLVESGAAASTINQALAAVRKLANEAAENGLMAESVAQGIRSAEGVKRHGVRLGNWLDAGQAQTLLNAPDVRTMAGQRDRAMLALLLGCGLRRDEAARLIVEAIQQRAGRWVIPDLVGKHGRVRTVPMPGWVKAAADAWMQAAGIVDGPLLRPVLKGGKVQPGPMSPDAIHARLQRYAPPGLALAPHDLRRTFAQLTRAGGAPLEQIQLSLGHASIATTERYLGGRLDLADAACDRLTLRIMD
jgi:site-specific recombinase XerD